MDAGTGTCPLRSTVESDPFDTRIKSPMLLVPKPPEPKPDPCSLWVQDSGSSSQNLTPRSNNHPRARTGPFKLQLQQLRKSYSAPDAVGIRTKAQSAASRQAYLSRPGGVRGEPLTVSVLMQGPAFARSNHHMEARR